MPLDGIADEPDRPDALPVNQPPKLLEQVRRELRLRHMSQRTEKAYLQWITRFIAYHRYPNGTWRHPSELGSDEVNQFLKS